MATSSVSGESAQPRPEGAVFLSYASEDASAAGRIAAALESAGIEVWFDKSALRGGDAWDALIRKQIKNCALFVPVISASAHARDKGYFRLEWKIAVDRSHLMAPDKPFLLPVVIDDTPQGDERIPDRFRELQWTHLAGGDTPAAFVTRVSALLSPAAAPAARASTVPSTPAATRRAPADRRPGVWPWIGVAVLVVAGALWFGSTHFRGTAPQVASFSPPPHSVAVLPFTNLSGDKDQQYFSDGLTEELLNSLSRSMPYRWRRALRRSPSGSPDIGTVAHSLNVGAVLEGSVRRSEHTVRITVQLINAITGFNLWSQSYDRDLSDVLKLQAEIATAVAEALKVKLLGDVSSEIELGNTRNPAALDALLRGRTQVLTRGDPRKDLPVAIELFNEALRLDPDYVLALANRSMAYTILAAEASTTATVRQNFTLAEADARHAIALAPELSEAHLALGFSLESGNLEFAKLRASMTGPLRWHRARQSFSDSMHALPDTWGGLISPSPMPAGRSSSTLLTA